MLPGARGRESERFEDGLGNLRSHSPRSRRRRRHALQRVLQRQADAKSGHGACCVHDTPRAAPRIFRYHACARGAMHARAARSRAERWRQHCVPASIRRGRERTSHSAAVLRRRRERVSALGRISPHDAARRLATRVFRILGGARRGVAAALLTATRRGPTCDAGCRTPRVRRGRCAGARERDRRAANL
jgi:hypothetical protein